MYPLQSHRPSVQCLSPCMTGSKLNVTVIASPKANGVSWTAMGRIIRQTIIMEADNSHVWAVAKAFNVKLSRAK